MTTMETILNSLAIVALAIAVLFQGKTISLIIKRLQ